MACPFCGCDSFSAAATEVNSVIAYLDENHDVHDTDYHECIEFEYTSKFECSDCEYEFEDIPEHRGVIAWPFENHYMKGV